MSVKTWMSVNYLVCVYSYSFSTQLDHLQLLKKNQIILLVKLYFKVK